MSEPLPTPELETSIARFTELFKADVAEQMDVPWERVLKWLEAKPTKRWTEKCPGWSPVIYEPAHRAKENIKQVFGLVLDYDKKAAFDTVAQLWANFYGLVYTTKSHNIDRHRVRVVLPLSRPVVAEEYDRLWIWADRQAKNVDLVTDGGAKDASRFWYEPTIPDGNDWRAQRLTGNPLDVDATLPQAELPQLRVLKAKLITADIKVDRARKYLAKIPAAVSGDAGHLQTWNAVSHVMIGFDLDADTTMSLIAGDYNPRCDPPWSEKELLHKIHDVAQRSTRDRGYLLQERTPIYSTQDAADRAPALPDEHDVDWRSGCAFKKDNTFKRAYVNCVRLVGHHPDYRGKWSLNTMTGDVWFDGSPMRESFIHEIRARADHIFGYTPTPADVLAAINAAAEQRSFHPVQQYLRSVDWDGQPRLSGMARDYLGSDSDLHAEMLRRWMIGAAARAMNPGCKLDTALMLYGRQGLYKSTFFAILGGPYHADSPIDIANKDSFQQIHAAWIYEFSELENVVTGAKESRLKAFLTSTHDTYRAPYARSVVRKPRAVALCGTTNRQQILTDDTGSRRFWIVPVFQEIPRALLSECRDQLWAEAVNAYESGESWWLSNEADHLREQANFDFEDEDPWLDVVRHWLSRPVVTQVTIAEVLSEALDLDYSRQDRWAQMRVARILNALSWKRVRQSTGDRRWFYRKSQSSMGPSQSSSNPISQ